MIMRMNYASDDGHLKKKINLEKIIFIFLSSTSATLSDYEIFVFGKFVFL
jgi:hypothetical protein